MATHFTADLHLFHKNILRFQPNRAEHWSTADEMNTGIINNWNRVVRPADTTFILGDVSFASPGPTKAIISALNGRKILVLGNHDKVMGKQDLPNLFEAIYNGYHETKIGKMKTCLNHYAQRVWNGSHHGTYHLYGHSHGSLPGIGKSVDVGLDSQEMAEFTGDVLRPWHEDEIQAFMDTKAVKFLDHHTEDTG